MKDRAKTAIIRARHRTARARPRFPVADKIGCKRPCSRWVWGLVICAALLATTAGRPSRRDAAVEYPTGSCVTDVKIEPCQDFDCHLQGYHRIDTIMNQSENITQWNYLFYKTEDHISSSCVTDLLIVEEDGDAPTGDDWYPAPHSALEGVTPGGGARLYSRRLAEDQAAGKVVDLVILKPGQWTNRTEGYIRLPVNLGLAEAAGTQAFSFYGDYLALSSGWVYLHYTKTGPRPPIVDLRLMQCAVNTTGALCGTDLIAQGWDRRDVSLNGATAPNAPHLYLFSSTNSTDGQCVTGLTLMKIPGEDTLSVNVNSGTNGTAGYLRVTRGKNSTRTPCLTSVAIRDSSVLYTMPGYKAVQDESWDNANFNAGVDANPVYMYWSTDLYPPPKDDITLRFNSTGGFRIAHIADHHLGYARSQICRNVPVQIQKNCSEEMTFRFIETALDQIKPDFVALNGDLYAANYSEKENKYYPQLTAGAIAKPLLPLIQRNIPYGVTFGNHDADGDMTREEIMRMIDNYPGFIGGRGLPELDGVGNYWLDIHKDDGSVGHRMWFFDSRAWEYFPNNGSMTGASGKVMDSQIQWYERNVNKSIPATAFTHIPLAQIAPELNLTSTPVEGTYGEPPTTQGQVSLDIPVIPTHDLFAAFVEKGDVRSVLHGHDHQNDFSVTVNNISLMYAGVPSYLGYSGDDNDRYNREIRVYDLYDWGRKAMTFKVIDDIAEGTVHRNMSEPVVQVF